MSLLKELPKPIDGKTGWPWTEEVNLAVYDKNINWPKISIVTPSFNQGHFIEETIRSILLQNYPNLEYIIIDGGSTDNTIEILKQYDQWITYWVSEPDKGQSEAINKGIKRASGEIFNWLNSDDYYLPDALQKVGQYFFQNEIDVLCGLELRTNGEESWQSVGTTVKNKLEETLFFAHIDQPPTFFKLSIVRELGPLNTSLHFLMDSEFWLRYLLKHGQKKILKISDVLNVFRVHEASKTSSQYDNFEIERSFLHYLLLKRTFVADEILKEIFNEKVIRRYIELEGDFKWEVQIDKININRAVPYLVKPYLFKSYFAHNYTLCETMFEFVKLRQIIADKRLFGLFFKVKVIPKKILMRLRRTVPAEVNEFIQQNS